MVSLKRPSAPSAAASRRRVHHSCRRRSDGPSARGCATPCHAMPMPPGERMRVETDPIGILHAADATRQPELVPLRYGRMLQSPFTFYRGSAGVMAADLAEHAGDRHPCPGMRRRPPDEFRRLRHAGAPADLRHQRSRRDLAGALGVGRQAARRLLCARRPLQRAVATRTAAMRRSPAPAAIARKCATLPPWTCWTSGTPGSTTATFWRCCRRTSKAVLQQADRQGDGAQQFGAGVPEAGRDRPAGSPASTTPRRPSFMPRRRVPPATWT